MRKRSTEKQRRDEKVFQYLNTIYSQASDDSLVVDETGYAYLMDGLFATSSWGFREIMLVVVVGMKLDSTFCASTDLYKCNPRALYVPIKEFLLEKDIPHRKDGALNIAKATVGLSSTWAENRRPKEAADNVVELVNILENARDQIDIFAISLLRRFIMCSRHTQELTVEIDPSCDPVVLHRLCNELIAKVPDSGNTPQKIAAFLLKNYHLFTHPNYYVSGGEDRASVTSTTSKKPGDINEECPKGYVIKVYEITVKPFDIIRIKDSYDCLSIYNSENEETVNEVMVICRPEDCPSEMEKSTLSGYMGRYAYLDVMYYFLNIYEWIASILFRMTDDSRSCFFLELQNYINDINTSEKVKLFWRELIQAYFK